jgi:hypothetical protein
MLFVLHLLRQELQCRFLIGQEWVLKLRHGTQ